MPDLAMCQIDNVIYVGEVEKGKTLRCAEYNATTGIKIRGDDLGLSPDEVLYRRWAQTQRKPTKQEWRRLHPL